MDDHRRQDEKAGDRFLSQLVEAQQLAHIGSWERNLVTGTGSYSEELLKLIYGAERPAAPTWENFLAQVHPEDRERVRRVREEEMSGFRASRDLEFRVQHSDGTVRVLHTRSAVNRKASGRAMRVFGTVLDITDRWRAEEERDRRVLQQAAVAQLGQTALHGTELQALFEKAVDLVVRNCDVGFAEVAELLPDETLLLRAAVGWKEGLVRHARLQASTGSLCAHTLLSDQPSVVEDLASETRFVVDPLILEQGIVSSVTVLIKPAKRPFGILGVGTIRATMPHSAIYLAHADRVLLRNATRIAVLPSHQQARSTDAPKSGSGRLQRRSSRACRGLPKPAPASRPRS